VSYKLVSTNLTSKEGEMGKAMMASVLVGFIALMGFAAPLTVSAEKGGPEPGSDQSGAFPSTPQLIRYADLTCSISRSGGTVTVKVDNIGSGNSGTFWTEYVFETSNGTFIGGNWYNLGAGQSQSYSYIFDSVFSAKMTVDKYYQVLESNEFNNHCRKTFYTLKAVPARTITPIG
jgi:hypothetical protein